MHLRKMLHAIVPVATALSFLSCKHLSERLEKTREEKAAAAATPSASASSPAAEPPAPSSNAGVLSKFEGMLAVQFKSQSQKEPLPPIGVHVKGDKFRFQVPKGEHLPPGVADAHVIFTPAEKKLFVVIDSKKQVIAFDLEKAAADLKQIAPPKPQASPDATPPSVRKTGEKAKVAGLDCDEWEISSKSGKVKVCVADESPSWFSLPAGSFPLEHAWAKDFFDGKHLPVRFVDFNERGEETARVELVSFETEPLGDELFAIPKDYQVLDIAQFIQTTMAAAFGAAHGAGAPKTLPDGTQLPANLPPEVKKQIEAMRARAAAARENSRSR